jgi:AbrB family looped-hinge helix DNA binding protein
MNRTPTAVARFTGNHQVSIPKPIREAIGLKLGDFLEVSAVRGTIVLRPKQLTDKPVPGVMGTPAELRALKRVRAADARGETIPYEQYRTERAARLGGRGRQGRAKAAR